MLQAPGGAPGGPVVHAAQVPKAADGRHERILVDGRLDEPAWGLARPAGSFRQREPLEGAPASDDTEVRVLFDHDTLYVGILARDREPAKVIARLLERDRLLRSGEGRYRFAGDDAVLLLLDPFRDRRNAFVFGTNANGAECRQACSVTARLRGVIRIGSGKVPVVK